MAIFSEKRVLAVYPACAVTSSSGHYCGVAEVPGHTSGDGERVETPSLLGCKVSAGSQIWPESLGKVEVIRKLCSPSCI